ncbi:MAG: tRNA preQ1(34) S-adenosylmethionine ribosyltransferase-isomerase QueA [Myxococcales bacterium]|nr:tRNA preQ1(34) S-adenosylmethionine ribosyltransferase-isomerase QueA [Myxococcales bacterium]
MSGEGSAFAFELPEDAIALRPANPRRAARLLQLSRNAGTISHHHMFDLPTLLRPGDLLVRNTSRVLAARLRGRKESGGRAEALLLGAADTAGTFCALLRCKGRQRVGQKLVFTRGAALLEAEVCALADDGVVVLRFPPGSDPYALGEVPLPPYIREGIADADDRANYQTIYADQPGSVAAPTAGLHFDRPLEEALAARGVRTADVVLHIGVGTFRPPRAEELERGELHEEWFRLPRETAAAVRATRAAGGRVVAVGTTSCRVLESCVDSSGEVIPREGTTRLFLRPGVDFRAIDALLTNFHLPDSSLLMLVAAFAGVEPVRAAYAEALARGYRFYSYGDAMLIQ